MQVAFDAEGQRVIAQPEDFTQKQWEGAAKLLESVPPREFRETPGLYERLRAEMQQHVARAALEAAEAPPGVSEEMRKYLQDRRMTVPEGPPGEAGPTMWEGTLNLLMRETGATPGRAEPDTAQQMELLSARPKKEGAA